MISFPVTSASNKLHNYRPHLPPAEARAGAGTGVQIPLRGEMSAPGTEDPAVFPSPHWPSSEIIPRSLTRSLRLPKSEGSARKALYGKHPSTPQKIVGNSMATQVWPTWLLTTGLWCFACNQMWRTGFYKSLSGHTTLRGEERSVWKAALSTQQSWATKTPDHTLHHREFPRHFQGTSVLVTYQQLNLAPSFSILHCFTFASSSP